MSEHGTLPKMLFGSCHKWGPKPALLRRVRGSFEAVSYSELLERVRETAAGLTTCGVERGSRVAIMAENSVEWALIDWAALCLGAVVVPIYPTLLEDTTGYILHDAEVKVAFAGDSRIGKRMEAAIADKGLQIPVVAIEGEAGELTLTRIVEDGHDIEFPLEELERLANAVGPEDTASIIYTSGTTGEPKGAVLPHRVFTYLCKAIVDNLPVDHQDRFLSFLPLSHVYERMAGHFLPISCGAEIAYAESLRTLAHDIVLAQPTIILAVPRFLDNVRNKVVTAASDAPGIKRSLFFKALARGRRRLENDLKPVGLFGGLLDRLVGAKVREKFGGRLRFLVSGGAALPVELSEFYAAFGVRILQGYGLTETGPVISVNHPARNRADSVGDVLGGQEVRIAADGEILVRGPNVMAGYHNKPEDSAKAIDADGWFCTGDIGRLEGERLWITDRKKDIIVLANGKNVAPLPIESRLKASAYVDEVMVFGDGMDYIAALIVPSFDALRHFCSTRNVTASHHRDMIDHPEVRQMLRGEVEEANRGLADFEKVKRHHFLEEPWTLETGELTPTLKVKRSFVKEKFAEEIRSLQ